jgi:hypothetical protein
MRSRPYRWPGLRFGEPGWAGLGHGRSALRAALLLEARQNLHSLPPGDEVLLLKTLSIAVGMQEMLSKIVEELVIEARSVGTRWEDIGYYFDVRGTAAQKRFGRVEMEVLERVEQEFLMVVYWAKDVLDRPDESQQDVAEAERVVAASNSVG